MIVKRYNTFEELPEKYEEFFAEAERENFFNGALWYRALAETVLGADEVLRFYAVEEETTEARPLGLLIARVASERSPDAGKRRLTSFETVYSLQGGPILRPSLTDRRKVLRLLFEELQRERPRWNEIVFKLIDQDSPLFSDIVDELRSVGMSVEPYFQYGNWYEELTEPGFDAYVARRGKTVRETLRWKYRKLDRTGRMRIDLVTGEDGLDEAIRAYKCVYETSWKIPEQYPEFIDRLIRDMAAKGYLRLGNLYLDDEPVATQLSIACADKGIMYKTAYDERVKKNLSIGGLLTLHLVRHLIEVDQVELLDFGVGDETYKKSWLSSRRERWGIIAHNMRTVRGALTGSAARTRHLAKAIARKVPTRPGGRSDSGRSA